jgi:hypothetical protein
MIMQGVQQMLSFRNVAVFIGVVGLLFGLVGVADAAHTKSHRKSRAESGDREMRGGPGKPEMILQGPVTQVSPAVGFIVIRHGAGRDAEEIPVEIDSRTTLMIAGKRANIDEVKTGDRVKIRYSGQVGDVSKTVDITGGPSMRATGRKASGKSTRSGGGL